MSIKLRDINTLDARERKKLLMKGAIPYMIAGGVLLLAALICLIIDQKIISVITLILGIACLLYGAQRLLWRKETKEKYIKSALVSDAIRKHELAAKTLNDSSKYPKLSKSDKEKFRFDNDPVYSDKVMAKVKKTADAGYNARVNKATQEKTALEKKRTAEIERIKTERWKLEPSKKVKINSTEGKVLINGKEFLFSEIHDVEICNKDSYRVKKGKEGEEENKIPTCSHLGAVVDLGATKSEIVFIEKIVDQDSKEYKLSLHDIEVLKKKLLELSKTPVPKHYLQPEEEKSVRKIDEEIKEAEKHLEEVKDDKPSYDIPKKYL